MKTNKKSACCGCTACYSICPIHAISMVEDDEGFLYPEINRNICIHCERCRIVCPFKEGMSSDIIECKEKMNSQEPNRQFYIVKLLDKTQCFNSRSGGGVYGIAVAFIKQNGIVYGVSSNSFQEANYIRIERTAELRKIQGSKYVQAYKGDVFQSVADDLRSGKKVLFTGLPCEISGLLAFIQTENINFSDLYTIDLLCHGVPSPLIWRENVAYLEQKWKRKILNINWRDKSLGWKSHIESYLCEDQIKHYSNDYTTLFYAGVILRPSCHHCPFCSFERLGDLTIGDFWGSLRSEDLTIRQYAGFSQVMINSEKGKKLFEMLENSDSHEISRELFSFQPNLFHPTDASNSREAFWDDYSQYGYNYVMKKYTKYAERIKVPYNLLKQKIKRRKTEYDYQKKRL